MATRRSGGKASAHETDYERSDKASGDADLGLLVEEQEGSLADPRSFIAAMGRHGHPERDQDPPRV